MERAVKFPVPFLDAPCRRSNGDTELAVPASLGKAWKVEGKKSRKPGKKGMARGGFEIRMRRKCRSSRNVAGR